MAFLGMEGGGGGGAARFPMVHGGWHAARYSAVGAFSAIPLRGIHGARAKASSPENLRFHLLRHRRCRQASYRIAGGHRLALVVVSWSRHRHRLREAAKPPRLVVPAMILVRLAVILVLVFVVLVLVVFVIVVVVVVFILAVGQLEQILGVLGLGPALTVCGLQHPRRAVLSLVLVLASHLNPGQLAALDGLQACRRSALALVLAFAPNLRPRRLAA